jgi:putative adhesin
MLKPLSNARSRGWIALFGATALVVPWSLVQAGKTIQEHRAADVQGEVEIVNLSGLIEVDGWDRAEVEVSGSAGDNVERVDVTSSGNRTSIRVVPRTRVGWGTDCEAHLVVHVPAKSAVMASLVSSDFKVSGLQGMLKVQTVSGNVTGDAGGDVNATAISGDIRLTARGAKMMEIKTISGDIRLTGGGGEVDVTTVSGDATVDLADVTRGRFKSVSGDLTVALALGTEGQIDSESVSGSVDMEFAATPAAEFDVQSFSGDIKNCFGPKPTESRYGPGSRLMYKGGEGHARVRINTKSGDVRLCVKGMKNAKVSAPAPAPAPALAQLRVIRVRVPYVL